MKHFRSPEARYGRRAVQAFTNAGLLQGMEVRAATGDAPAEIMLYDEIGMWGVSASEFVRALAQAGDGPLTLRINSPGGDVFDGMAMYNALKARTQPVTVVVDGIAASAASFVAMAGETVQIAETAMLMIHDSWTMAIGNRHDLAEQAAVMAKIDGQMASIYAARTGKTVDEIAGMMDAETWLTGQEAKDAGFADAVINPPNKAKAAAGLPLHAASQAERIVAAIAPYDPDNDGDNDAAEAVTLIQKALDALTDAVAALTGNDDDADTSATAQTTVEASASEPPASPENAPDEAGRARRLRMLRLAEAAL